MHPSSASSRAPSLGSPGSSSLQATSTSTLISAPTFRAQTKEWGYRSGLRRQTLRLGLWRQLTHQAEVSGEHPTSSPPGAVQSCVEKKWKPSGRCFPDCAEFPVMEGKKKRREDDQPSPLQGTWQPLSKSSCLHRRRLGPGHFQRSRTAEMAARGASSSSPGAEVHPC